MSTLTSRMPDPTQILPDLPAAAAAMVKAVPDGVIPRTTVSLMHLRAGQLVGSTYHTVRATGDLREAEETTERITAVATWRDAPYFTDAERIALELMEAVLSPNPAGDRVPDELYTRASAHYDDKALWTLIALISQICYFIPVALIARPIPGQPPGQNYRQ